MDGLTLDRHKIVPVLDWPDLTQEEQSEHKWAEDFGHFFRYLGVTYCFEDFLSYSSGPEWDGIINDTFFSGVFIKFEEDFETVHCVRYMS